MAIKKLTLAERIDLGKKYVAALDVAELEKATSEAHDPTDALMALGRGLGWDVQLNTSYLYHESAPCQAEVGVRENDNPERRFLLAGYGTGIKPGVAVYHAFCDVLRKVGRLDKKT